MDGEEEESVTMVEEDQEVVAVDQRASAEDAEEEEGGGDDDDDDDDDGEDLTASLPEEVLEFALGMASPYGELRAARAVSRRWRRCADRARARAERALARAAREMALRWSRAGQSSSSSTTTTISKRYSHSACYDDRSLSVFVFGGCTSTSSTFNDLWRLDLTTRTWSRPMSTGTYPSPKACAVMVLHESSNSLLLFGGWTHPSLYPLHQSWRLFNELHQYDLGQVRMAPGPARTHH